MAETGAATKEECRKVNLADGSHCTCARWRRPWKPPRAALCMNMHGGVAEVWGN